MSSVIKTTICLSAIVTTVVTALTPLLAAPLPLEISFIHDGDDMGETKGISMNIPVEDTTQPIYGGVVRYYDVAVAQAVAITYRNCSSRQDKGVELLLTAGSRKQINMGKFYISCDLAYDLVSAYGLNDNVVRPVRVFSRKNLEYMPSLNLDTDAKAQRFVSFSSNFKPVER